VPLAAFFTASGTADQRILVIRAVHLLLLEQASVDRCSDALTWALRIPRKLPRCSIHLTKYDSHERANWFSHQSSRHGTIRDRTSGFVVYYGSVFGLQKTEGYRRDS
jgi:hypothetical protein